MRRMFSLFIALVLIPAFVLSTAPVSAATAQTLAYTMGHYEPNNPNSNRRLIYVNNPEGLSAARLADLNRDPQGRGPALIYVQGSAGENYRLFFGHSNKSGAAMGYGILFFNNSSTTATLTVQGRGFAAGGISGGTPWAQLFNSYGPASPNYSVTNIAPNGIHWIRWDNINGSFSGVVDFNITGGNLLIRTVAYRTFSNLPGSYYPMGYVTNTDTFSDGTTQDQRRVYKGVSTHTATILNASYTITSSDVGRALPLNYQSYGGFLSGRTTWVSNIDSGNNSQGIGSDMAAFSLSSLNGTAWTFSATTNDASGRISNLGNWGIVYRTNITITNNSGAQRTVSLRFQPPAGSGFIQFAHFNGTNWTATSTTLGAGPFTHRTVTIANGATATVNGFFVLGAPSFSNLTQSIFVQ